MKLYRVDEKFELKQIKMYPYFLVLFVVFLLTMSMTKRENITQEYEKELVILKEYTGEEPFSLVTFKQFIKDCGIRFPDIVIAQAVQECNFNSMIWKENNNPFGMKIPGRRHTTNIGTNRGHAKFKNWRMAVLDYAYMQAVYARNIKKRSDYYKFLNSYSGDENYTQKLKSHLHKYKGFGISNDYLNDL